MRPSRDSGQWAVFLAELVWDRTYRAPTQSSAVDKCPTYIEFEFNILVQSQYCQLQQWRNIKMERRPELTAHHSGKWFLERFQALIVCHRLVSCGIIQKDVHSLNFRVANVANTATSQFPSLWSKSMPMDALLCPAISTVLLMPLRIISCSTFKFDQL